MKYIVMRREKKGGLWKVEGEVQARFQDRTLPFVRKPRSPLYFSLSNRQPSPLQSHLQETLEPHMS
jgi:hypothetical protein